MVCVRSRRCSQPEATNTRSSVSVTFSAGIVEHSFQAMSGDLEVQSVGVVAHYNFADPRFAVCGAARLSNG